MPIAFAAIDITVHTTMQFLKDYVVWVAGATITLLTAYGLLRKEYPKAAAVVYWPCKAGWWCVMVIPRCIHWGWQQAWLQKVPSADPTVPVTWVHCGPVDRYRMRWERKHTAVVIKVMTPEFESVRTAAREQHDAQNQRLDKIERLLSEDNTRWRDKMERRVYQLEELATQPPRRSRPGATKEGTDK